VLEQICGVEGCPLELDDGWWLVGKVIDVIVGVELDVLGRPGQTIRLREIVEPAGAKAQPLPLLPERPKPVPVSSERGRNPLKWDEW
jgi:hypothetical protein